MAPGSPSHLQGIVDMGSNGIRFSITDLHPSTARSLPVVYQDRLGVSLYDAQFSSSEGGRDKNTKGPIPQTVIDDVITALKRFQAVCADFSVPEPNIKVLATEATRNATNSAEYRQQIRDATGWEADMLPKEAEGRIGAMGIASSFESVEGLVMDLGGGSTQLTWMVYTDGEVTTSPKGSVSFPYGAAAITKLLEAIDTDSEPATARAELKTKIKQEYTDALSTLELPESLHLQSQSRGLTLYLSGGGFRGWGYILMSKAKFGPYPIPIINGYQVPVKDFRDVDSMQAQARDDQEIFRVSKRRASQVPAVAFLVGAITDAFPFINDVRFCQGGVREGFLFDQLSTQTKSQSPLSAATSRFAAHADSSVHLADLLASSIPANGASMDRRHPPSLTLALLRAVADTMYVQSNAPKESASLSALYLPITGVLAAAHGISHSDRALLGLMLCQRWDPELPPPHDDFRRRLQALLTTQEVWWTQYLGAVAGLVGDVYPSGRVVVMPPSKLETRIKVSGRWADGLGKKGNQQGIVLDLKVRVGATVTKALVNGHVNTIEGMGKKKNRVGGKEYGFGVPLRVDVEWL